MNKRLSCIIVEDDPLSTAFLKNLIRKTPFLDLKNSFQNPIEAIELLNKENIDLMFLDIELPQLSGLELMRCLGQSPQIIITSSKQKYALDAFDFDVCDFLLKPINDYSRFLKAALKALAVVGDNKHDNHLFVKVNSLLVNIDIDEILWCEAYGDYVKIYTTDNHYIVYTKFSNLIKKLPPSNFFKVHRSFLVNLSKIANIDSSNIQIRDRIIPISVKKKHQLMSRLNTL